MPVTKDNLESVFTYHPPNGVTAAKYARLRAVAKEFATAIIEEVPMGADQQAAIRKLREALMTANAGIATDGAA